jgi:hypothetical protein
MVFGLLQFNAFEVLLKGVRFCYYEEKIGIYACF